MTTYAYLEQIDRFDRLIINKQLEIEELRNKGYSYTKKKTEYGNGSDNKPIIKKQTIEDIEEIEFDSMGAFIYSKEEDTKAYLMKNQVKDISFRRLDTPYGHAARRYARYPLNGIFLRNSTDCTA